MNRIVLIRHGRTEANDAHLYCGSTDLPLSESGAEALRMLQYEIPDAQYFTSGMLRTEQTLAVLFGSVPHTILPEFREIDFGIFEMHSYMELKDDPDYQAWITGDNERNVPPQGESGEAMTARVRKAWASFRKREGNLVLISHGGVIAAIMEAQFPEAQKNRYQWQPSPGSGYVIENGTYRKL